MALQEEAAGVASTELLENGAEIAVTDENKGMYVEKVWICAQLNDSTCTCSQEYPNHHGAATVVPAIGPTHLTNQIEKLVMLVAPRDLTFLDRGAPSLGSRNIRAESVSWPICEVAFVPP